MFNTANELSLSSPIVDLMKVSSLFKVEKLRSASQLVIGSVAKKTNGAFDILSIGSLP